ncbi:Molybdenum cofactor biosynthesis protein B [Anatilimnocola aggregata]|uniref:Molybdenum cofactor biosynthesis protein B n=1 Tax=Anatilimnocola aggregata TaxID=2528021 RepID=A0A517Y7A0_9BACT|nr:molybdenum cofactor biosynthesis protein B [Anatilimnocola aggregata]QDU26096.1 Molybdenum cofactor biosynthesis protein B [Anatilimnocola aggregata]
MPLPIHQQHEQQAPAALSVAVITVSDTRTTETDTGGQTVIDHLLAAGHQLAARYLIKDEPVPMRELLSELAGRPEIAAILLTGGTGISSRDQTYETVSALLDKPLPGYGELFRQLSYAEIGPAAILSRAAGGVMRGKVVLTMPGSPNGVRLAMEKVIIPQLRHLVREASR